MAKALKALGCIVTAFCSSRLDLGYSSRWVDRRLRVPKASTEPATFLELLKRHLKAKECDVLIPLVDDSAVLAAEHKVSLAEHAHIAVNDLPIFIKARDKLLTMAACAETGVAAPRTLLTNSPAADLANCGLPFPLVVKPRCGYGALGFSVVNTMTEAQTVVRQTEQSYGPVLIQEYIPQTGLQYKAELMMSEDGTAKAAVVFSKVRWYPLAGGSSTLNATVHRPDIVAMCIRLLKHLGWVGYADVDLIEDPRDKVPKVMEINPRITGSVKITFQAGVNFADLVLRQCLGQKLPCQPDYTPGVYLRYLLPDILWFMKSPARFSCTPSWFRLRGTADQIYSFDDPLPGITYTLQSGLRLLFRRR